MHSFLNLTMYRLLLFVFSASMVLSQFHLFSFYDRPLMILDDLLSLFQPPIPANEHAPPDTQHFKNSYDFIVIGAGSGGSVVTNRLTEIPEWDVLLLEAGGDEMFMSDVPLMSAVLLITDFNWGFKAKPSNGYCTGLENGVCNWPRGKGLGGTSIVNFMVYTRGNKLDYDHWEELGNPGWSFDSVLKYFKKFEDMQIPGLNSSPYHNVGGGLTVEASGFRTPLSRDFLQAGREFGYNVTDPNGASQLGFSEVQATLRRGRRCSASKAFLRPIRKRRNLHIAKHARVTKILIDPITKKAYGVEFVKNKTRYRINVTKEVILAAGTLSSPQLLMLSGVGPREHLEELGIPVIQDLKVGYNLQDHVTIAGLTFLINDHSVIISEDKVQNPIDILNYIQHGKGPFSSPGGAQNLAFVKTKYASVYNTDNLTALPDYPDLELVLGVGALNGDRSGSLRQLAGITPEFYNKVYGGIIGRPAFTINPILMRPYSRGRVSLKSKNPFHWPIFEANYFQDERDMKVLVEGIKMAIRLSQAESFKKYGTTFHTVPYPGCEYLPFGSDKYWECCIRRMTLTLSHQSGTCKMGPSTDPDAVVDPELKVYGVENLRVVDASIMPTIVAGHTNAPVFMIGEKAADMIKDTWTNLV